jgi:Replication initiator protein, pSAM2
LLGVTQKKLRKLVRAAYVKVAEYQRRGLVHVHAVIRLDRAMPKYRADELKPPRACFTTELLEQAIRAAVADVFAPLPDELGVGTVRWGGELDVRHLDPETQREVAGYLAKYATKKHRTRRRAASSRR